MSVSKKAPVIVGLPVFLVLLLVFAAHSVPAQPATSAHKKHLHVSTNLVFDATVKFYNAKTGEMLAPFQFDITNTWTNVITVDRLETSCGCTVASLPANPWHMQPGEHGTLDAAINLEGKAPGHLTKLVTLYLSANKEFIGTRVATLKVTIPERPKDETALPTLSEADRKAAMQQAKADPRKIFTDASCAKCHVDRGVKSVFGPELYAADCGICHDSPNRASFV